MAAGQAGWFVAHKDAKGVNFVAFWQASDVGDPKGSGGGWLGQECDDLSWVDPSEIALYPTKAEAQALAVALEISGTTFKAYAHWAGDIGVYWWDWV